MNPFLDIVWPLTRRHSWDAQSQNEAEYSASPTPSGNGLPFSAVMMAPTSFLYWVIRLPHFATSAPRSFGVFFDQVLNAVEACAIACSHSCRSTTVTFAITASDAGSSTGNVSPVDTNSPFIYACSTKRSPNRALSTRRGWGVPEKLYL